MFNNIYRGKKVFLTGHTGFKGSWLSLWLIQLGAKVCGYALEPNTSPSMFDKLSISNRIYKSIIGDVLDYKYLEKNIIDFEPDIIFHLAAQPLVRLSYAEPVLTYQTNVIGTLNLLQAARKSPSVKAIINVTSDKCYENKEDGTLFAENDILGGYDMYSSSKACVEIMTASYRRSFLQDDKAYALATVRAGNVIGGGDWALDRLIPDCIRSINSNVAIQIRNPSSVRPWQHVLEPLSGYLLLGQKLFENGHKYADCFNFGPDYPIAVNVAELTKKIIEFYGKGEMTVVNSDSLHEAGLLMLNVEKSRKLLGWKPCYDFDTTIKETVDWYKNFYANDVDMFDFTVKQIEKYEGSIKWKNSYAIK